jgi:DUF4097 and DUF4098 domain-containing protein YvlB
MRHHKDFFRSLGLACAALLLLSWAASAALARDEYQEKFEKTLDLAMDGKVYLSNVSGDIKVFSWDKAQVKISALKSSEASSRSKAEENAKEVTIEINGDSRTVRIETKYPKHGWWGHDSGNVSVDFTLYVPAQAAVDVNSVSGDVDIDKIDGSVRAKSVSGDVTLAKASAGAEISSVSGDVKVSEVKGGLDAGSVSGDVVVGRVEGSIEATSVSGDVKLRNVLGADTVRAKTVSGDVEFEGLSVPKGRYILESHSGDVTISLPAEASFELEAETFSGDIDSDFSIKVSGKVSPRQLRGTVNQGGPLVTVKSFSGSINLRAGGSGAKKD